MPPKPIHTLFEPTVPLSLIQCISDLLKYDPEKRLTSYDCVNHPYLRETAQKQPPPPPFVPLPPPLQSQRSRLHVDPLPPSTSGTTSLTSSSSSTSLPSIPPRNIPHSHSFPSLHQIRSPQQHYADVASPVSTTPHSPSPLSPMVALPPSTTMTSGIVDQMRDLDLPADEYRKRHPRYTQEDVNVPTMDVDAEQHTAHVNSSQRISQEQQQQQASAGHSMPSSQASSSHKGGLFTFGKKKKTLGIFGGNSDKSAALPPVEEIDTSSNSVSLKRTQSGSTGSHSFDDKLHPNGAGSVPHLTVSNTNGQTAAAELTPAEVKKTKKEILMEQRQHARERQKAMSRRVLQNRDVLQSTPIVDLEYLSSTTQAVVGSASGAAAPSGLGVPRRPSISNSRRVGHSIGPSVDTRMDVRMVPPVIREEPSDPQMLLDRSAKARRRDTDDDHSQSSVSISLRSRRQSVGTMDSDPGPSRSPPPARGLRERPSEYNIQRAASKNSLRSGLSTGNSSLRGYSSSARSSTSLELGVVTGFADMSVLGVRGIASPSEIMPSNPHSQHFSHPHPHSPLGQAGLGGSSPSDLNNSVPLLRGQPGNGQYITLPPLSAVGPGGSGPPYPLSDKGSHETLHLKREVGMDPGRPPGSPMNPMFQVVRRDAHFLFTLLTPALSSAPARFISRGYIHE